MFKKFLLFLFILALLIGGGVMLGDFIYTSQRFPVNTFIESIDVSNLKVGQVIARLRDADVDSVVLNKITLYSSTESREYMPSEIGAYIRSRDTAYKDFRAAYESNYLKNLAKRVFMEQRQLVLPLRLGLDDNIIRATLEAIAKGIDDPAVDAKCVLSEEGYKLKKKYRLTGEKIGHGVHVDETISLLKEALADGKRISPLIVAPLLPRIYRKDLVDDPPIQLIAKFKTKYGIHDSPNRIHNIKLISSVLDNYIMLSGEAFSMLSAMGDISKERGFKEAYVIVSGELEPQYGGGACQVATTLYNAALLADFDMVSRHNHAIYFHIYPLGRDSSVYAGSVDLKFVNNTGYPIMLKSSAGEDELAFRIYGTPTGKSVTFTEPKLFVEKLGMVSREAFAFDVPFRTTVERTVYLKDAVIKKEVIKSYYRNAGEGAATKVLRPEPD